MTWTHRVSLPINQETVNNSWNSPHHKLAPNTESLINQRKTSQNMLTVLVWFLISLFRKGEYKTIKRQCDKRFSFGYSWHIRLGMKNNENIFLLPSSAKKFIEITLLWHQHQFFKLCCIDIESPNIFYSLFVCHANVHKWFYWNLFNEFIA